MFDGFLKEEAPVRAEPFTLEHFASWLGTMPPAQEYDPTDPSICALGQYGITCQGNDFSWYNRELWDKDSPLRVASHANTGPYTFGAALDRARKLLAAHARTHAPTKAG